MAKVAVGLLLASLLSVVTSAPVSSYDQSQHGELNVHAQFDNIAIILIPSSNLNMLSLFRMKNIAEKPGNSDKGGFIQFFQKPHKIDIDRYETSDASQTSENSIKTEVVVPVITSQQEDGHNEEEVVATVEEMKPETIEKTTDAPKLEATEDSLIKKHSTVSETIQESVLKVSVPEELKDAVETEDKEDNPTSSVKILGQDSVKASEIPLAYEETPNSSDEDPQKPQDAGKAIIPSPQKEMSSEEVSSEEHSLPKTSSESSESDEPTIKDFIRPVAEKEKPTANIPKNTEEIPSPAMKKSSEQVRLMEGVRKEKVIRYKPESKWAPELVDLLGPPRQKPKDLEERRFASLCSPGVWDTDLKTCIMPEETRSRSELARFLEAMRFGIAVPAQ